MADNDFQEKTIWVADDDSGLTSMWEMSFELQNARVRRFEDPYTLLDALEKARETGGLPDAIVTDYSFSRGTSGHLKSNWFRKHDEVEDVPNGGEVIIRKLAQSADSVVRDIPVFLLTGNDRDKLKSFSGNVTMIQKPVAPAAMRDAVYAKLSNPSVGQYHG